MSKPMTKAQVVTLKTILKNETLPESISTTKATPAILALVRRGLVEESRVGMQRTFKLTDKGFGLAATLNRIHAQMRAAGVTPPYERA
jgi:predicted transcriptional regulator